ncbi:hypothetical protein FOA52_016236 [Chlamydomonas sp. UWO 241]|nr:hypothetical protein FOA52_016236 [Chlamydomonas sp. UWO 241]
MVERQGASQWASQHPGGAHQHQPARSIITWVSWGKPASSRNGDGAPSRGSRGPNKTSPGIASDQEAGTVVALKPGEFPRRGKHAPHATRERGPTRRPISANVDLSEIVNRQRGPRGFKVIEFFPSGIAKEWERPMSAADLGIHPRDLSLFLTGSRLANQRATFTVQDRSIFIKTENVRAIVRADKAVVFKSRSDRENQNIIAPMLQAITSTDATLPFELCAVEVLLHSTVMYFERRISHLSWMLDIVMHDLQGRNMKEPFAAVSNETMIQQLVPLDKALMAARIDAKEVVDAIQNVLMDDETLAAACLTQQAHSLAAVVPEEAGDFSWQAYVHRRESYGGKGQTVGGQQGQGPSSPNSNPHDPLLAVSSVPKHAVLQAERMLQSYEREMGSVESTLREMEENLNTTRQLWSMKLDSARNHMMLLNLWLSMVSISLMVSALPAAVYGMNVEHGMEGARWYFYVIAGVSVGAGLVSFPAMNTFYRRFWQRRSEDELSKVNRLRIVLMQHLDDLDDILEACDTMPDQINRTEFARHLKSALPDLRIGRDTLEFLFQQFDSDKNGTFDSANLLRTSAREVEAMGKVPPAARINRQMLRATTMTDLYDDDSDDQFPPGR